MMSLRISLCRESRCGGNALGRFVAGVEQSQGGFGQVAFVGDLPFVMGLDQNRAGQAQQCGRVREHPDDVGAALDLLIEPFDG